MADAKKALSFLNKPLGAGASAASGGAAGAAPAARGRVTCPTKNTINLAQSDETRGSWWLYLIAFLAAVVVIGLFSKFLVVDQLASGMASSSQVNAAKQQLTALQQGNADYAALSEEYARYVVSGLTEEETGLSDREDALDLFSSKIVGVGYVQSLKVLGNQLTATCVGVSMPQVSALVEALNDDARVSRVTVTTAQGATDATTQATIEVTLSTDTSSSTSNSSADSASGNSNSSNSESSTSSASSTNSSSTASATTTTASAAAAPTSTASGVSVASASSSTEGGAHAAA